MDRSKPKDAERLKYGTVRMAAGAHNANALSVMPAELVDFFIKYYARAGETYLDPFMGQGVQLQVALLRGMKYVGYDVSREFFRYIESFLPKLTVKKGDVRIFRKDARKMTDVASGSVDFTFTSPPYWDTEFYGNEPEQLGFNSYEGFLEAMEDVAREMFRAFRPGGVAIINVNDFRKEGRFYAYHADTIALFARAGWTIADVWIISGLVGQLPRIYALQKNLLRTAPRVHEYALVFRKTETRPPGSPPHGGKGGREISRPARSSGVRRGNAR